MANFADEVATWSVPQSFFKAFARRAVNASLAQHFMELDDASLVNLRRDGALLIDIERIRAGDLGYASFYVLTEQREISTADIDKWRFPRFTPRRFFDGLEEFAIVERHCLGQKQDERHWRELGRVEQIGKVIAYAAMMDPLEEFFPTMSNVHVLKGNRPRGAFKRLR